MDERNMHRPNGTEDKSTRMMMACKEWAEGNVIFGLSLCDPNSRVLNFCLECCSLKVRNLLSLRLSLVFDPFAGRVFYSWLPLIDISRLLSEATYFSDWDVACIFSALPLCPCIDSSLFFVSDDGVHCSTRAFSSRSLPYVAVVVCSIVSNSSSF